MLLYACSVAGAPCGMVEGVSQGSCSPFNWAGLMYPLPGLMGAWHSLKGWVGGQSHAGLQGSWQHSAGAGGPSVPHCHARHSLCFHSHPGIQGWWQSSVRHQALPSPASCPF